MLTQPVTEEPSEVRAVDPVATKGDVDRRVRLVDRVALAAVVLFALVGIGTPLLGLSTFSNTDLLVWSSPYYSAAPSGDVNNLKANDIISSVQPNTDLFVDELRRGNIAAWNPYVAGGGALGAVPNFAVLSPLTLPAYLLPHVMAPGYIKLLEIAVSVGFCFLFLRRLGLGRAAGWLGGLAFASSGFMVVWSNWPQTRVAAFIPMVFWAVERLAVERRARDVAWLAAAVAAMLLGGFPAITGYTLLTAGIYLLVRVVAVNRGRAGWLRPAATVAAGAAALVGALAISAVQLLPFVSIMSGVSLDSRAQTGADHLGPTSLLTAVTPWALGSVNSFELKENLIESMSYVGATALVVAFLALALPWAAKAFLPRGVWTFLVAATGGWLVVIYVGGPPLEMLQRLPMLFSESNVGRARSVLGFLVAALVAIGFEMLLRRARLAAGAGSAVPLSTWQRRYAAGVVAFGVLGLLAAAGLGFLVAYDKGRLSLYAFHVAVGVAFLALGAAAVALIWRTPGAAGNDRRLRALVPVATVAVPALVLVQALSLAVPYWPAADRDTYYPRTEVHAFLAENLGHDRFAAADSGMYAGADSAAQLRSLTGETFFQKPFAQMIGAIPDVIYSGTLVRLDTTQQTARSPLLDRLSVRYLVTPPWTNPFGAKTPAVGDGSAFTMRPGEPVTLPLTTTGGLRGAGVTILGRPSADTRFDLEVRGADGTPIVAGSRLLDRKGDVPNDGKPIEMVVSVLGEDIPAGTRMTAQLTMSGPAPVRVVARDGRPAVAEVAARDDGLRLVYTGDSLVWRRDTALPRIRWASDAVVVPGTVARIETLQTARPDQVVLDRPPATQPQGRPAAIDIAQDGTDEIRARVDAQGAGYLVVADSLQSAWVATVDGRPADLVAADQGLVAVAVPEGVHDVRLSFQMPYHGIGAWISLSGLLALVAVGIGAIVRDRRRRHRLG